MLQMEIKDDLSTLRSSTRSGSPTLSTVSSETNDKRRSLRGRRSSMSVKQVVDGIEITKDVIIGNDMIKVDEKNSSLISLKMAAVDEEKEHLMSYMEKLNNEKRQWDEMLQSYEKNVDIAKSELNKSIVLSPKRVEEARIEYMGVRDAPSPIEFALAMKPSLEKKIETQISQNQKLEDEVTAVEDRLHRLQELIKIQEKYLNYENKNALLAEKAEYDAVILQIENWMAKYGFSERLSVI
ncbi:hypothetical protein X798_05136 [Onchocerca flexuosa]|uniref:Uncharacterized protein n=1 Tax=Onchocerca flexuosa TaxID=387005 RepID=A0A238BSI1_9BILA|nr:hypothetical protein X798_05136 [Onchocerca flexuosa]